MSKLSWISASVVINYKAALSDSYPSESSVPMLGHSLVKSYSLHLKHLILSLFVVTHEFESTSSP